MSGAYPLHRFAKSCTLDDYLYAIQPLLHISDGDIETNPGPQPPPRYDPNTSHKSNATNA